MNEDYFVYCIKCKHFKFDLSQDPSFSCEFEDECDIWDFDCGRRFSDRPHYEGIAGVFNGNDAVGETTDKTRFGNVKLLFGAPVGWEIISCPTLIFVGEMACK